MGANRMNLPLVMLVTGLLLAATGPGIADGLGVDLGGISVDIGTSSGLSVDVGVGSAVSASAAVGGSGVGADVDVGPSGSVASVGASVGSDGVGAAATVGGGSVAAVNVGVGGTGVNVGVSVGGSGATGNPGAGPGGTPNTPGGVIIPAASEVRAAQRRGCQGSGNSAVYNDYLVFDSAGMAVGLVKSASVGSDLRIHTVTISTLDSFASPAKCLQISDRKVKVGSGALQLSHSGNSIHRTLAQR